MMPLLGRECPSIRNTRPQLDTHENLCVRMYVDACVYCCVCERVCMRIIAEQSAHQHANFHSTMPTPNGVIIPVFGKSHRVEDSSDSEHVHSILTVFTQGLP